MNKHEIKAIIIFCLLLVFVGGFVCGKEESGKLERNSYSVGYVCKLSELNQYQKLLAQLDYLDATVRKVLP